MKVITDGFRVITVTGNYSFASFEYTGLVIYSMINRSGIAVGKGLVAITLPAGWAVSRPFAFIKDKSKNIFTKKLRYDVNIKLLEEKIMKIEDRLDLLEKLGVVFSIRGDFAGEKKLVSSEKRMLLHAIVEENKHLLEGD